MFNNLKFPSGKNIAKNDLVKMEYKMIEPTSFDESVPGLLIFEVGGMKFCTDLRIITVVLKPDEIEQIQSIDSEGSTTILYNNQEYKLIHFNRLVNLEDVKNIYDSRIILLSIYEKRIAFFVDRVTEILSLDKIFIEESIDYKPNLEIDYVCGVLKFQNRTCYFPDYERIAKEF